MTKTKQQTLTPFDQVSQLYSQGIAHAFILHFNVRDYAAPGVRLKDYIARRLASRLTVFYNVSQGIHFAMEGDEEQFRQLTGLDKPVQQRPAFLAGIDLGDEPEPSNLPLPPLPIAPTDALPVLERFLTNANDSRGVALVVDYAEAIAPAGDTALMSSAERANIVTLARWGTDPNIEKAAAIVFLLTENIADLHPALRAASSKWEIIPVNLPDFDRRLEFTEIYFEREEFGVNVATELTPRQVAATTAGLSLVHIEDIFLRAEAECVLDHDMIRERKRAIIRSEFGDVIELVEPRFGWDFVGGLAHVKNYLTRSVVNPMRDGNINRVPMGVLMTGPAGTGKSIVAEALAYEAGINMARFNPAKIYNQFVGNSERNLEKVLLALEQMAPIIVFIDEIDQSFRRGETGDSGVSQRIFRRLLEFMADGGHRGKIVFLAASNRPDLIDAAPKREGRLDKKIPFLIPNDEERRAIIQVMVRRYLNPDIKNFRVSKALLRTTEGWTGAEIEAAAVKAYELMTDEDMSIAKAMLTATRRLVPSTQAIEMMTRLALENANDPDLVPAEWHDEWRAIRQAATRDYASRR